MTDEELAAIRVRAEAVHSWCDDLVIMESQQDVHVLLAEVDRLRTALGKAFQEGRNVIPDATDDQAATIEAWAAVNGGR